MYVDAVSDCCGDVRDLVWGGGGGRHWNTICLANEREGQSLCECVVFHTFTI